MRDWHCPVCGGTHPIAHAHICGETHIPPFWKRLVNDREAKLDRAVECLKEIEQIDWTEPPTDMPDEIARATLTAIEQDGDE